MIEFPGLWGLKLNIDPVALHLGKFNIYWYGIIIAVGFALAVYLATRDSKKFGIDPENIVDVVLWATIPSIICARIYYIIFSWKDYQWDFYKMINIREGGIAVYGSIIGALLVAYIYATKKKIGFLKLFDFALPYFVLAQAIGRWGNFVNQEAFGSNTTLPWGMTSERIRNDPRNLNPALPVHPTFLYESIWNLGVFFFLIWFRKKKKFEGEVFFLYMILYGLGRFWVEGLRTDSLMLGNFRISQVLALIFVFTFGAIFFRQRRKLAAKAEVIEKGTSSYGSILKEMESQVEETSGSDIHDESSDGSGKLNDENKEDIQGSSNMENSADEHQVDINKT